MNVLDLFSGIGGFSLGLERAGMKTVAFCEIEPFCQKILRKHWPDIPIFPDVKKLHFGLTDLHEIALHDDEIALANTDPIDVICGGFPCQDISVAGPKTGLKGKRSGLWKEFKRLIKEIEPTWALIENVANLRGKGCDQVLKDLWSLNYDIRGDILPAKAFGAPYPRARALIVARNATTPKFDGEGLQGHRVSRWDEKKKSLYCGLDRGQSAANFNYNRQWEPFATEKEKSEWWAEATDGLDYWSENKPPVYGVDARIPHRVDRIKALGNCIVPQVAEFIGRQVMKYEVCYGDNLSKKI